MQKLDRAEWYLLYARLTTHDKDRLASGGAAAAGFDAGADEQGEVNNTTEYDERGAWVNMGLGHQGFRGNTHSRI